MLDYTFQMFDILIARPAIGLSDDIKSKARQNLDLLKKNDKTKIEELEDLMINFGKQAWPYWQAFEEFEEKYGREKEKELFESTLKEDLKKKWKEYEASLLNKAIIDQGNTFEKFFTPEENHQIEEAVVDAKGKTNEYLTILAKEEKSDEYSALVTKFQKELTKINKKIKELEELKISKEKWSEEIDKQVRYFKKGIAQIELDPTEIAIQEKIDFFTSKN